MSTLRIAVIGAGGIARRYHLPSLARLQAEVPGVTLAAVCDVDPARAEDAARRYGFCAHYTDYPAMLEAVRPDAVWALVPYQVMRSVAGDLLARGVPTLMEKPPSATLREARELAEIAARHRTPHQVALNRRYVPLLRRMRDLLAEAGGPQALSCQFYRHNRREPTFAYGTGIHGLDALRYLGPGEVVEAHVRPVGENGALVTMIYSGGETAQMQMLPQVGVLIERYVGHAGPRTVEIDGLFGPLTTYPGYLRRYDEGRLVEEVEAAAGDPPEAEICGFYGESAAFVDALRAGRAPTPSLEEALPSVGIAEAVNAGRSWRA